MRINGDDDDDATDEDDVDNANDNFYKMPACISIQWRCSSSRPCTHLNNLHSP